MQSIEIRCKSCGKKLLAYDQASTIRYKSPVKNCKKCGTRYADPRCHEIAIEGIPKDSFSIPSYVIMMIIGALILYRGIFLFWYTSNWGFGFIPMVFTGSFHNTRRSNGDWQHCGNHLN